MTKKYLLLAAMLAALAPIVFTPSCLKGTVYPIDEIRLAGKTIFDDSLVVFFHAKDGPCAGAEVCRRGADGQRLELTFLRPSSDRKPDLETFYPDGPEGRAAVRVPFIRPRETYRLYFTDGTQTEYHHGITGWGEEAAESE